MRNKTLQLDTIDLSIKDKSICYIK